MAVANLAEFERKLDEFSTTLTVEQLPAFLKKIVLQLLERSAMRTPVDTGRAVGGFQISFGSPTDKQSGIQGAKNRKPETARRMVIDKALKELSKLKLGENIYMVNNVEYILHIENGTEKVAAVAMVKRALQELGGQVE